MNKSKLVSLTLKAASEIWSLLFTIVIALYLVAVTLALSLRLQFVYGWTTDTTKTVWIILAASVCLLYVIALSIWTRHCKARRNTNAERIIL